MKTISFIFFVFALFQIVFGQNCKLTTSTGALDATCLEELVPAAVMESGEYIYANEGDKPMLIEPAISIIRNGDAGYFIIKLYRGSPINGRRSKYYLMKEDFVKDVFIYLNDNSVITLKNRGVTWEVNDNYFSQYILTSAEVEKLKNSNIYAVRFWLSKTTSALEFYNISYKYKSYTNSRIRGSKAAIDFPAKVRDLFKNK